MLHIGTLFIRDITMGGLGMRLVFWKKTSRCEILRARTAVALAVIFSALLFVNLCSAQSATSTNLPSETPDTFTPVTTSFDFVKRDVMMTL